MNLQAYEVEFLETASQIPNDLWDDCFQPPAEGRWWYEALDKSGIDDQFTFFYCLIKSLGYPIGIAPIFVMENPPTNSQESLSKQSEEHEAHLPSFPARTWRKRSAARRLTWETRPTLPSSRIGEPTNNLLFRKDEQGKPIEMEQSRSQLQQHLMERSFADAANRHGFRRARWRGLVRQSIQQIPRIALIPASFTILSNNCVRMRFQETGQGLVQ
jgi:hypothetical protein